MATPPDVAPAVLSAISAGLLPDPKGLIVWDLGCGDGRFSAAFLALGAAGVLASDLNVPPTGPIASLLDDPRMTLVRGGFDEVKRELGDKPPVDLIFMSLMTEHVDEPRSFFRALAELARPDTEIHVHHDNFFQPTGHHDHGLISLDPESFSVVRRGPACWESNDKCEVSKDYRDWLCTHASQLWSRASEDTKNPTNCESCNYFRRSRPWAHLIYREHFQRTFPEPFFTTSLNRFTPEQILWAVEESGFETLKTERVWIMNPIPDELADRFGRETLATFTLTIRMRLRKSASS